MKRVLRFLLDHWYIPLLVSGAVLLWILTAGKRVPPVETIKRELEAIRAGAQARAKVLVMGKVRAVDELRKEHAEILANLKDKHAAKAEELRNDPVALSRFLIRAGRPDA